METSVIFPRKTARGICRTCTGRKSLLRMQTCSPTRIRLKTIVQSPSVSPHSGKQSVMVAGMHEMGEVPRNAFLDIAMAKAIMESPRTRTSTLLK